MSNLKAKTFDSNVWYHITEGRVDNLTKKEFQSSFQTNDDKGNLAVWPAIDQYWQLQPVSSKKGRYALRLSNSGVFKQLAVCYFSDEIADSRTRPCMRASDGTEAQMWDIADWGDSTYRLVNVANGTDYVLDVHPGNPPFLSNDLRTDVPQPAQHWLMTSVKDVDDGAFSTTFTNKPTSTGISTTATKKSSSPSETTDSTDSAAAASETAESSSSSSSSSGLSTGAAAGIGVGVGLGVLALAVALFFFWKRRRNNAARNTGTTELGAEEKAPPMYTGQYDTSGQYNHYSSVPPQELSAEGPVPEADSTPVGSSVTTSPETRKTTPGF
ncbi:Fc.00g108660.m01.CDS01 [Cosmosporella sp. VM-42]